VHSGSEQHRNVDVADHVTITITITIVIAGSGVIDVVVGDGVVEQESGNACTMVSTRAATFIPVSGSNLTDRFHIPSRSTHDFMRALRRCRLNRSMPSPSWSFFASRVTASTCSAVIALSSHGPGALLMRSGVLCTASGEARESDSLLSSVADS